MRNAQRNYLRILENRPGHFLGYLLSTSPKIASGKPLPLDTLDARAWPKQYLNEDIRKTIEVLATQLRLTDEPIYHCLLKKLEPPRTTHKPTTHALKASGVGNVELREPNIEAFRSFAGDWLWEYAKAAGVTQNSMLLGVRAQLAIRHIDEDAIIWIKIERAQEVLHHLFPDAATTIQDQELAYSVADCDGDDGSEPWCYVTGASVSALTAVCPKIISHLEVCQLRRWELQNGMMEKTDCITMKKSIANPQKGLLRLRFSCLSATYFMNQMFNS
ncbi:hypothetical protein FCOIX_13901 [Fusarium coicis]|nr:hypothetical protein FCOIX_13901 [Fusarium coicis]